jgi:hypothetical protein
MKTGQMKIADAVLLVLTAVTLALSANAQQSSSSQKSATQTKASGYTLNYFVGEWTAGIGDQMHLSSHAGGEVLYDCLDSKALNIRLVVKRGRGSTLPVEYQYHFVESITPFVESRDRNCHAIYHDMERDTKYIQQGHIEQRGSLFKLVLEQGKCSGDCPAEGITYTCRRKSADVLHLSYEPAGGDDPRVFMPMDGGSASAPFVDFHRE